MVQPDSTHSNVVGGWHDASDYWQYVTTPPTPTYHLLAAFGISEGLSRLPPGEMAVMMEAMQGWIVLDEKQPGICDGC